MGDITAEAAAIVRYEEQSRGGDIKPTTRFAGLHYRSARTTAQLRRNAKVLALRKRLRKSGYREGRKASATAQPLTDGRTDTIYSGSELQSTHGRPTRMSNV